ncbi:lipocalin-15 isoform B [Alligator mississippiensis]|uniref:Lipocalin-15 isoform B n=1 Tax=Alligator mississippiensis TaxID=8496 RepID=A0A151MF19_ALLMI|nr:lipocalin-15 isoform B [Alligator mississippiensis]
MRKLAWSFKSPADSQCEHSTVRMEAMLLNIGLALLCVLKTQAEVPVQPDFDLKKFTGTWHIVVGASNCPVFLSMKEIMKTSVAIITAMPGGDLTLTVGFPLPDACQKIEMHLKSTGQPGHYTNSEMGKRDMRVVETDYDHYAIVYMFKDQGGETSVTLQLFNAFPELPPVS